MFGDSWNYLFSLVDYFGGVPECAIERERTLICHVVKRTEDCHIIQRSVKIFQDFQDETQEQSAMPPDVPGHVT